MCHHGHKPEYCGECLIAGVIPPLERNKGTGNVGGCSSPYIYIQPEWKPEVKEEIFDDIDESEETPGDTVEVLIPPTRPLETKTVIPELCPHSGIIVGGITYCGHCQKDNTGAVGAHIMLTDLMQICKEEGRRKFYYRVSNEDQVQTAFEAVWSKLAKIMAQMRHADVRTTLRIYAHVVQQTQRDAMEGAAISTAIGTVVPIGTQTSSQPVWKH
jgi:hypothetical protein